MGALEITQFEPVVEANFRLFGDGIRRWRDIDIAEWLAMASVRQIRTVIKDNRSELERHGGLLALPTNPSNQQVTGGRPANEFWLRFEQAMVICTQSRTLRAEDVRTVMIKVFTKFVNGEISAAPRMELRALEVAADRIVAPILKEQREFHSSVLTRMDRHEARIGNIEHAVVTMRREAAPHRKDFKQAVRSSYIGTVITHYNCKCPCCRAVDIIANGKLLPNANFEHWFGCNKARAQDGWLTCNECNQRLIEPEFRLLKSGAFQSFQDARLVFEGHQPQQGMLFV